MSGGIIRISCTWSDAVPVVVLDGIGVWILVESVVILCHDIESSSNGIGHTVDGLMIFPPCIMQLTSRAGETRRRWMRDFFLHPRGYILLVAASTLELVIDSFRCLGCGMIYAESLTSSRCVSPEVL